MQVSNIHLLLRGFKSIFTQASISFDEKKNHQLAGF